MRKTSGLQLQTSIVQDNVPVEITTGLFVGSIHAAFNIEVLKLNNISHVLNHAGSYEAFPEDFTYLSLGIRDKECANLLSCLPVAAIFIDAGLKHSGVLIHCVGGRSRSPAVAMAFLMMKQRMPYANVSAHVKGLRPVVKLNAGFDAQLKFLAMSLLQINNYQRPDWHTCPNNTRTTHSHGRHSERELKRVHALNVNCVV